MVEEFRHWTGKGYQPEDIIILKSGNFHVPTRMPFPRNPQYCIALSCLPFNYDEKAKCPEIDKALDVQWDNDQESKDLFLQFLYYSMKHTHIYKAILCMVGESDSGKTQILELIRQFIGIDACEALSLSKIGNRFELYRARNAKLLISDDMNITSRDLLEGSLVENIKSIPSGAPIRYEGKGGDIRSKVFPCQIILAGNQPPKIPQFSNALANRFYFLVFPHIFIRNKDMDPKIIDKWLFELPGLLNKVLDAGIKLDKNRGFIEPRASERIREIFEGGGSPIKKFIQSWFDINAKSDSIKWFVRISDMKTYYEQYCREEGLDMFSPGQFNDALQKIVGIRKTKSEIKVPDEKGKMVYKSVRGWEGLRRKGTSGILTEAATTNEEF